MNIGKNLKRLRKAAGLSQEKLCAKLQLMGCDVQRSTYEKYESGELIVRVSVLVGLSEIYDCSYDEFFVGLSLGD